MMSNRQALGLAAAVILAGLIIQAASTERAAGRDKSSTASQARSMPAVKRIA